MPDFAAVAKAAAFATVLFADSALAEVCDKAHPSWDPGDGPVTVWDEFVRFATLPFVLSLIVLAAIALLLRWRIVALMTATPMLALAVLVVIYEDGGMHAMMVGEGCATGHPTESVTLLVLGALIAGTAILRKRTR